MCCALAGDSDAVAALLQSVCEITLSETREVEAAVAFDWTERLHDEALAGPFWRGGSRQRLSVHLVRQ